MEIWNKPEGQATEAMDPFGGGESESVVCQQLGNCSRTESDSEATSGGSQRSRRPVQSRSFHSYTLLTPVYNDYKQGSEHR